MDLTTWTTKEIVGSIVATGAISAVLTNLFGWIRDHLGTTSKNKRSASYLAMRLASILESYTVACGDFISYNNGAPQGPEDQYPNWDTGLPDLPPYPDDPDGWRAMDRRLADRCLRLRNNIAAGQSSIGHEADYNTDNLDTVLKKHGASLGREAWILARDLRYGHDLLQVDMLWDPDDFLVRMLVEVEEEEAAQAKATREMYERMEAASRAARATTA